MHSQMHSDPTERDKLEDLWRQCDNLDSGTAVSVICPWCFKINRRDLPGCCRFFTQGIDQRGKERFESVLKQFKEIRLGSAQSMHCPYCDTWTKKPAPDTHPSEWPRPMVSPFCCSMMADAATAIVERIMLERLTEDKKRIEDGMGKVGAN